MGLSVSSWPFGVCRDDSRSLQDAGWAFGDETGVGDAVTKLLHARGVAAPLARARRADARREDLPLLRNQLFRDLVEREGIRAIVIESDSIAGRIVDDFVTVGAASLDDVMQRGFSHGFGASPANRELVQ